ncbi:MtrB/PioB family decaheme-associated outer membrane protein [uncultured Ferrimonas sp.]|uniref:MtrB/PioB family decaheme-associated outer membrane protein n=1 Tax=uncultured Ferrimonas sp. TaxID=432640 RepID=UPI002602835B|nr:MtrB/PioB family decaheme-associated outer membrane protein [uncultured Ferrimonas sp.]
MKLSLNLITLALVTFSGTAMANYGLANANTDKVNLSKWQCKKCVSDQGSRGTIGVSAGFISADDDHASNRFSGETDGPQLGLTADVDYYRADHQANFTANELGSENGNASLTAGKTGVAIISAEYARLSQYSAQAQSRYVAQGGDLIDSGALHTQDLKLQRERYGFGIEANIGPVETYANYRQEEKTGSKVASIFGTTRTNVVAPVDGSSSHWQTGARFVGSNWFTGVSYSYAKYDNNLGTALDFDNLQNAMAYAPSNDASQLMLNGAYQFGRSNLAGRIVSGQMNQDSGLVANTSINGFDGQVDTLDASLKFTTLVSSALRLTAALDHSDRDNKSTILAGPSLTVDELTGQIDGATMLDTTKTSARLGASYRIASGYRLLGDYRYQQKQQTAAGWDEEETQQHSGNLKLKINAFDKWDIAVKAGYSQRDMSQYDADRLLSGGDNALLRRYNLADRDRTIAELAVTHTPLADLSIDFNAHWAKDDYSETEIGLTEGEDHGYDLAVNYQLGKANLHAFTGMQWINSDQAGSSNGGNANWFAEVEDTFVSAGVGADYPLGQMAVIGIDYQYADSDSETMVKQGVSQPYGDYFATSHRIELYTKLAVGEGMDVRVDYQYQRYQDSDFSNAEPNEITSLVTLGNLDHNYNAHRIMLSFNYQL